MKTTTLHLKPITVAVTLFCCVGSLALVGCASTETSKSTGEYIDDAAITAKVKTELAKDPDVSAMQVDVTTFKGRVQLSGFVNNAAQKDRAAQLARGVNGVREVTNNLLIK